MFRNQRASNSYDRETREEGVTLLHEAVRKGRIEEVRMLLGSSPHLNAKKNRNQESSLQWAVADRQLDIIGLLLQFPPYTIPSQEKQPELMLVIDELYKLYQEYASTQQDNLAIHVLMHMQRCYFILADRTEKDNIELGHCAELVNYHCQRLNQPKITSPSLAEPSPHTMAADGENVYMRQDIEALTRVILKWKVTLTRMVRDGNSLYRAIHHQLKTANSKQNYTPIALRQLAITHLRGHTANYAGRFSEHFETYLHYAAQSGSRSDLIEAQALSRELKITIIILESENEKITIFKQHEPSQVVLLGLESNNCHYHSLAMPTHEKLLKTLQRLIDETDVIEFASPLTPRQHC